MLAHYRMLRVLRRGMRPCKDSGWRESVDRTLKTSGDDWLPLQIYDDTGLLSHGSDPFIDMIGGMRADVQPGERVLSRMILKQKPHNWSEEWREKALSGAGSENQQTLETDRVIRQEERTTKFANSHTSGSASGERATGGLSDKTSFMLAGSLAAIIIGTFVSQTWWELRDDCRSGRLTYSAVACAGG